jgi:phage tail sheath gpL-like
MSGGTWTQGDVVSPQTRPGAYFNLIAQAIDLLEAGNSGVVLIVGRADWGPVDTFETITSEGGAELVYGTGLSITKLIKQALRGGAATVLAHRIAGSSAAAATATLDDTLAAAALTITAKYDGARANNFTLTVADHPVSGGTIELKESGTLLETFYASDKQNDTFNTVINATSDYLISSIPGASDLTMDDVADAPLSGGDSGGTVIAGDYTAAQGLAEAQQFDVYVQDDDTTAANQNAVAAWADARRAGGQLFFAVHGGAAAETAAAARTRAQTLDSISNVYVHPGFTDTDGVVYIAQEAAARVAGLIASKGFTKSITFAEIVGAESVELAQTTANIGLSLEAGVCVISTDGSTVRVEKGINTYTSWGTDADKDKSFTKIRTIATLDAVVEGLDAGFKAYIGDVTNDVDGWKSLLGAGQAFLDQLIQGRAIKPGATVALDDANPPTADQLFVKVGVTPLDSVEQVFTTVYVSA